MSARHEPFTAVLLYVLLGMSALHFGSTLVFTVYRLIPTVALMLLERTLGELLVTMLAVSSAAGTSVPEMILHQYTGYHRSALRRALDSIVLTCVEVRPQFA